MLFLNYLFNNNKDIRYYETILNVKFETPKVHQTRDGETIQSTGYFQNLLIAAKSKEGINEILEHEVDEGLINWQETSINEKKDINSNELPNIKSKDLKKPIIISKSGYFLYP